MVGYSISSAAKSLLGLIYPPLCLHCTQSLRKEEINLCASCSTMLDPLDPKYHCPFCFAHLESSHQKMCAKCRKNKKNGRLAAVFDDSGPAQALHRGMTGRRQPYLAKGAAAYLAFQWHQLGWTADVIVPVPLPLRERVRQGYDYNQLLAAYLSALIGLPFAAALKHEEWSEPPYQLREKVHDQTVLLVMDRSEENFEQAARALAEGYPRNVYGLAFINGGL